MKLQKMFFQSQFGFSHISALIGLGVASMGFVAASQMVNFSFKSQKSLELRLDRQAIARHLFSRVDCGASFTPTTCNSGGYKILRDSDNIIVVNNVAPLTLLGNYTIRVECSADDKYLIVRAATLSSTGILSSTSDGSFRADPMTNKIVKWDNDISLLFPLGVGICSDSGSGPSKVIVSTRSEYMAGNGFIEVSVPIGTKFVSFNATAHGNTGSGTAYEWTSEDTIISSGTIDLVSNTWSGYRALTGGTSDSAGLSSFWNNEALNAYVTLLGDVNTSATWHSDYTGTNEQPRANYNVGTRILRVYNLSPDPVTETVIHFTYFK